MEGLRTRSALWSLAPLLENVNRWHFKYRRARGVHRALTLPPSTRERRAAHTASGEENISCLSQEGLSVSVAKSTVTVDKVCSVPIILTGRIL